MNRQSCGSSNLPDGHSRDRTHACTTARLGAYRYVPGRSALSAGPVGRRLAGPGQLAHLLELLTGRDLLGEQRRLDAVEQPLEPADELGLGDPELAVARDLVVLERQRQRAQLLLQIG